MRHLSILVYKLRSSYQPMIEKMLWVASQRYGLFALTGPDMGTLTVNAGAPIVYG
jgi:hypothetical protein